MGIVTLRYWAAAKDAAGVAEEKVEARTLAEALGAGVEAARARAVQAGHGRPGQQASGQEASGREASGHGEPGPERLSLVLSRSSFLIDGQPAGTRRREDVLLADGAVVEVLPPFAGG